MSKPNKTYLRRRGERLRRDEARVAMRAERARYQAEQLEQAQRIGTALADALGTALDARGDSPAAPQSVAH